MDKEEVKDFEILNDKYIKSLSIAFGSPDQYQYHQNELCKEIARFILKPYWVKQMEKSKEKFETQEY
jgi:hypothetical protein